MASGESPTVQTTAADNAARRKQVSQYVLNEDRVQFEGRVQHAPHDVPLWLRYGEFELRAGDKDRFLQIMNRCVRLNPQVSSPWPGLIRITAATKSLEVLERLVQTALETFPDNDEVWSAAIEHITDPDFKRMIYAQWCDRDAAKIEEFIAFEQLQPDTSRLEPLYEHWVGVDPQNAKAWRNFISIRQDDPKVLADAVNALYFGNPKILPLEKSGYTRGSILQQYFRSLKSVSARQETIERILRDCARTPLEDLQINMELHRLRCTHPRQGKEHELLFGHSLETPQETILAARLFASRPELEFCYERLLYGLIKAARTREDWTQINWVTLSYCLYTGAASNYLRSIELSPYFFAPFHIALAKLRLAADSLGEALEILHTAQEKEPTQYIYEFQIGLAHELRDVEQGRLAYANYLAAEPQNQRAWSLAIVFENKWGNADKCRGLFELALYEIRNSKDRDVMFDLYAAFERNNGTSASQYETLISRWFQEQKSPLSWYEAARVVLRQDSLAAAHVVLEEAVKFFVPTPDLRYDMYDLWREFETQYGTRQSVVALSDRLPQCNDGDYYFPDDHPERVKPVSQPASAVYRIEHSSGASDDDKAGPTSAIADGSQPRRMPSTLQERAKAWQEAQRKR